jgi:hypothetical protein
MSAAARLAAYRNDPILYVRETFGVEPDIWQAQALESIKGPGVHRLSLKACAGPGKSALAAWVSWWFISLWARPGSYPKGALLSNSWDNLQANLWAEMHKWRSRSAWLQAEFEVQSDRIFQKNNKPQWFLDARSFAQKATPEVMGEALSGIHAEFVLIVLDEAGGTHPIMLKRAEQAMSKVEYGLILLAGNPSSLDGALYKADSNDAFTKIRITGDPEDPNRSPRVDIEQARDMIKLYGREDPWVRVFILGMFPPSSFNALLSEEDVRASMGKHLATHEYSWAEKRIGIDVAREGIDRTCLAPRQGRAAFPFVLLRGKEAQTGPVVGARYAVAKERFKSECDTIDATGGWATSVLDYTRLAGHTILPINMSEVADDPEKFHNKRAECYWRAAEWVKSGGALPPEQLLLARGLDLVKEATVAQYTINNRGRFQIEEKAQIKKRLGFSPDGWDAFCLTFATAERASRAHEHKVLGIAAPNRMAADVVDDENPLNMQLQRQPGRSNQTVDMQVLRSDDKDTWI